MSDKRLSIPPSTPTKIIGGPAPPTKRSKPVSMSGDLSAVLAAAAADESASASPMASFDVRSSSDFEDSKDPEAELKEMLENIASLDWTARYGAVESVRRLSICHPDVIGGSVPDVLSTVLECAHSLRSAVARNALYALGEMFSHLRERMLFEIERTTGTLLLRATNDKRFIRDAALDALNRMTTTLANETTLTALLSFSTDKSHNVCGQSGLFVEKCMTTMGAAVGECKLQPVVAALGRYHAGKAPEARRAAKGIVQQLKTVMGIEALEKHVRETLPPLDATAVIRDAKKIPRPVSSKRHTLREQITAARRARMRAAQRRPRSCLPAISADVDGETDEADTTTTTTTAGAGAGRAVSSAGPRRGRRVGAAPTTPSLVLDSNASLFGETLVPTRRPAAAVASKHDDEDTDSDAADSEVRAVMSLAQSAPMALGAALAAATADLPTSPSSASASKDGKLTRTHSNASASTTSSRVTAPITAPSPSFPAGPMTRSRAKQAPRSTSASTIELNDEYSKLRIEASSLLDSSDEEDNGTHHERKTDELKGTLTSPPTILTPAAKAGLSALLGSPAAGASGAPKA